VFWNAEDGNNNDYIPLVSSLVQIAMDAHCRSIEGFQELIEREWVAFGHRFADRCGLTAARDNERVRYIKKICVASILRQSLSIKGSLQKR
jgi:hypothetical protein